MTNKQHELPTSATSEALPTTEQSITFLGNALLAHGIFEPFTEQQEKGRAQHGDHPIGLKLASLTIGNPKSPDAITVDRMVIPDQPLTDTYIIQDGRKAVITLEEQPDGQVSAKGSRLGVPGGFEPIAPGEIPAELARIQHAIETAYNEQ